ncbi:MAG TPA: hypothetical protein P5169_05350, partial [Kiritimatiellia bacterium]|nr:hypothetical protein [Kiritimatiellia bacterium]
MGGGDIALEFHLVEDFGALGGLGIRGGLVKFRANGRLGFLGFGSHCLHGFVRLDQCQRSFVLGVNGFDGEFGAGLDGFQRGIDGRSGVVGRGGDFFQDGDLGGERRGGDVAEGVHALVEIFQGFAGGIDGEGDA